MTRYQALLYVRESAMVRYVSVEFGSPNPTRWVSASDGEVSHAEYPAQVMAGFYW
ncbi:cell division protein kinase [Pseudomonas sp. StFLB209]|nr:cell division protein kinase [Pseudomonas sp. StFLB209]